MATARRVLAVLVPLALALGLVAAAPSRAAATITLTSLSITPTAVSPTGLTTSTATVSVGLVSDLPIRDDCGIVEADAGVFLPAFVTIARVTPEDPRVKDMTWDEQLTQLARTSGTATAGVWTASIPVASTWTGTWQVSRVYACTGYEEGDLTLDVDPRTIGHTLSLTVTGTHVPTISFGHSPNPVPWTSKTYTLTGRVYDTATGAGLANLRMEHCEDSHCGVDGWSGIPVTTTSTGYFSVSRFSMASMTRAMAVFGAPHARAFLFSAPIFRAGIYDPAVRPSVTSKAARASVPTGKPVSVAGRLFGVLGCGAYWNDPVRHPIQIQYLHGRTAWRLVATTSTRPSARWNVIYPARSGRTVYRAYHPHESQPAPYSGACAAASSTAFVVTGT